MGGYTRIYMRSGDEFMVRGELRTLATSADMFNATIIRWQREESSNYGPEFPFYTATDALIRVADIVAMETAEDYVVDFITECIEAEARS